MTILQEFSEKLASDFHVKPTTIFAKILTPNDDSGKHGVLIPNEAYGFLPDLPIPDPTQNSTILIPGIDIATKQDKRLGWKYYERYPERRITRLNNQFNDRSQGRRLAIFVKATVVDGSDIYLSGLRLEDQDADFWPLFSELFGDSSANPGIFVHRPLAATRFQKDQPISELLDFYDQINSRGWIDSLRIGDTGIGYTFETLIGIKENNDQIADYKGIEIKCKLKSDKQRASGKINLFQMGPAWAQNLKMIDRLRSIGTTNAAGLSSCYSQVTPVANNLGLKLLIPPAPTDIDLRKNDEKLGSWSRENLANRLEMKHSRAIFIKANTRKFQGAIQYRYCELVYCEKPDIDRFVDMVERRKIVFEFAMHEGPPGKVRNHGYPWRLVNEKELETLFGYQIKLRG